MSYYLNVDEIYEVGEEIERNGKAFYEAAARWAKDPAVRALCEKLAGWEAGHVALFEAMRRKLPEAARENGAFDPAGEEHAYLRAAADDHVFRKNEDVHALVARCKSPAALLDLAIRFEKDSLVYYGAMKKLVPHAEGLDALIAEEQRHVETLAAQRAKAAG